MHWHDRVLTNKRKDPYDSVVFQWSRILTTPTPGELLQPVSGSLVVRNNVEYIRHLVIATPPLMVSTFTYSFRLPDNTAQRREQEASPSDHPQAQRAPLQRLLRASQHPIGSAHTSLGFKAAREASTPAASRVTGMRRGGPEVSSTPLLVRIRTLSLAR